jgi:predicted transcriptional regulator
MTIELPREIEAELSEAAHALGVSVGQYIEGLVVETNLRRAQIAEFRATIDERMASIDSGDTADGEEVMARLINDPALR